MDTITAAILVTIGAIIILIASRGLGDSAKIVTKVFLIFIVSIALLSVFVFNDLNDLKVDVSRGNNLFVLREGEKTYAAVGIKPIEGTTFSLDSFDYYNSSELAKIGQQIDLGEELAQADRTFILTPDALNSSYTLDFGKALDQNDLLAILESQDPLQEMAQRISSDGKLTKEALAKSYGDESRVEGYILAALVINYFKESAGSMSENIKDGSLKAYPETISFKVLKYLPLPKIE